MIVTGEDSGKKETGNKGVNADYGSQNLNPVLDLDILVPAGEFALYTYTPPTSPLRSIEP